jgi:preprotein translocase subunit SecG
MSGLTSLFAGFLTVLLVLDCIFLVLLILIQLPKKEAGAGIAFGGAATDALFGAGSGNVLTKITKYLVGAFFALSILLAILSGGKNKAGSGLLQELGKASGGSAPAVVAPATSNSYSAIPAVKPLTVETPATSAPAPVAAPSGTNK